MTKKLMDFDYWLNHFVNSRTKGVEKIVLSRMDDLFCTYHDKFNSLT